MIPIPRLQGHVLSAPFVAAMSAFFKHSKMSIVEGWRYQGRLLFERIMNWRGGAIATPPKTLTQGKKAVQRDIYRAVFPLRAEAFTDVKMRKRVRSVIDKGDHVALQEMARKGVFGIGLKKAFVARFSPKMHQSQRRSRGRVTGNSNRKNYVYATDDVDQLKAYSEKVQSRVGQGKGGWASALIKLGGKPAAWIAKHVRQGTCEDRLHPANKRLSFAGINQSAWASGGDEDRIIGMAMEGRAMAIVKDLERRIEDEWRKKR